MTKLDPAKTRRAINRHTGRPEIVEAVSADGHWGYAREDDRGTRWYVRNLRTGGHILRPFGTLSRARGWTHTADEQAAAAQLLAS